MLMTFIDYDNILIMKIFVQETRLHSCSYVDCSGCDDEVILL